MGGQHHLNTRGSGDPRIRLLVVLVTICLVAVGIVAIMRGHENAQLTTIIVALIGFATAVWTHR